MFDRSDLRDEGPGPARIDDWLGNTMAKTHAGKNRIEKAFPVESRDLIGDTEEDIILSEAAKELDVNARTVQRAMLARGMTIIKKGLGVKKKYQYISRADLEKLKREKFGR